MYIYIYIYIYIFLNRLKRSYTTEDKKRSCKLKINKKMLGHCNHFIILGHYITFPAICMILPEVIDKSK